MSIRARRTFTDWYVLRRENRISAGVKGVCSFYYTKGRKGCWICRV